MSGASYLEPSCPVCGDSLNSIQDCFCGQAKHLDNFAEVEDYLRDQGSVTDDEYALYADRYSRDEYETALANRDREPRDGPFIADSIVCTETWCTSDTCDFSRRTFSPPPDINLDDLTDENGEVHRDYLSAEAEREAEKIIERLSE